MNPRLAKQLIYGFFYLLILGLIILGIWYYYARILPIPTCLDNLQNQGESDVDCGGPCAPCEISALQPFDIYWRKILPADENQSIVVAEIKNQNSNFGADFFEYTFDIHGGNDQKIGTVSGESFIYPGEIKYLMEVSGKIKPQDVENIELSFSKISWKSKEEFPKPQIQIRDVKTETTQPIFLTGIIKNESSYALSKIKIIGFVFNRFGLRIGASKTELNRLSPFQETTFKIVLPITINPSEINPDASKIFAEVKR